MPELCNCPATNIMTLSSENVRNRMFPLNENTLSYLKQNISTKLSYWWVLQKDSILRLLTVATWIVCRRILTSNQSGES